MLPYNIWLDLNTETVMSANNEMTGGEALARMLQAHAVGPMFGMGGFQLLPFYDATRRLGLDHNLINDERAAVFAADAYAKVSGRVGVCDATLGPGATNLVTGLVEALNAGSPMVVIVGDAHRQHAWKNMTQEARQTAILEPACKELIRVEMIERIPELTRRAFAVATSGRPGPVVLDVPEDIAHGTFPFDPESLQADARYQQVPAHRTRPSADAVAEAAAILRGASKPMLLAGGGVHLSDACDALQTFAETYSIPVAHTMTGKGAIACNHDLSAGLFGRYDRIANALVADSDCLLVVGCKLGEIATKRFSLIPDGVPLIHLELVAEEIGRTTPATVPLWGDVRESLRELDTELSASATAQRDQRQDWASRVSADMDKWRDGVRERLESNEVPVNMARMLNEINQRMPENGLLVADGGFAAHWGGLLFDSKRAGRSFIPDRGFASIGYGLPGTMGARLAAPGAPVLGITGDGGFNMILGELETARRMKLGFGLIIVNNAASGYVKALQHLMYGDGAYQASELVENDYAKIANAMGCEGIRVEHPDELGPAIERGLVAQDCPVIIDVVVTRDPAKMLPGVDNRTVTVKKGDRVA